MTKLNRETMTDILSQTVKNVFSAAGVEYKENVYKVGGSIKVVELHTFKGVVTIRRGITEWEISDQFYNVYTDPERFDVADIGEIIPKITQGENK